MTFRRKLPLLAAGLLLVVAAPPANATPDRAAASGGEARPAALDPETPVLTVAGRTFKAGELERAVRSNIAMRHAFQMGRGREVFEELLAAVENEEFLVREAERRGLEKEAVAGTYRYRENYLLAVDFTRKVIEPEKAPTEEEIESMMPKELRTFRIRQAVLPTREDAEAARAELEGGADFVALIRERSISPESRKDGMLWDYRAGGGIYKPEHEEHIFSLPIGVYSGILDIGTGFAVARVEEILPADPRETRRTRKRIRDITQRKRVDAAIDEILKATDYTVLGREEFFALARNWWEKGVNSDAVVVKLPEDSFTFREFTELSDGVGNLALQPDTMMMYEKLRQMADNLARYHVVAREAEKRGHVLAKNPAEALEFFRRKAMLDLLMEREVTSKAAVKPDEFRPWFEKNIARFSTPDQVELRHILVKDFGKARGLQMKIREGLDFEEAAEEHTVDRSGRGNGGYLGWIRKGDTPQTFEGAAFGLKEPGDVSDPVATTEGWHLIQLIEIKPAYAPSFEEVRSQVEQSLRTERTEGLRTGFISGLRKASPVKREAAFDEFRDDFISRYLAGGSAPPKNPHKQ